MLIKEKKMKVLFIVKDEYVVSVVQETIYMRIPDDYDYILWLPISVWNGNHIRFSEDHKVERIMDLKPKRYIYIKEIWEKFKDEIKQE